MPRGVLKGLLCLRAIIWNSSKILMKTHSHLLWEVNEQVFGDHPVKGMRKIKATICLDNKKTNEAQENGKGDVDCCLRQ